MYLTKPTTIKHQRGIALTEVLVALLLLAIGVLGFAALQFRAVAATSESLNRTQALAIIRGLGERMAVNNTSATVLDFYKTAVNKTGAPAAPTEKCVGSASAVTGCSAEQLANLDAYQAKLAAWQNGISLGMAQCPGTVGAMAKQCLLAAWDETRPVIGNNDSDCIRLDGNYRRGATCVVLEVF